MKKTFAIFFLLLFSILSKGQDNDKIQYAFVKDIAYVEITESDEYKKERCKLDIYYPKNRQGFATIVWFHGGGLEGGGKGIPNELKDKGYAIVAVNYRLSPKAGYPAYIEDAAQSVAWVFNNIQSFGGSPGKIYISGHSAGGYLTLMVGLDKSYLAKYNIDADSIKGLLPISGQTNTHYTIRKERKLPDLIPIIDEYAPLNQARKGVPPTLLITGDRRLEMTARYEENLHLEAILKALGNKVELLELQGFDHGNVYIPGCLLMADWIKKSNR
ncbi:alpha/beta hydrolase [Dysgonomonas sp. 511]|uniref:alpha/beta hydrolase n=1 Tax=Dysgonomonas sp. 511 TaxID=2302930 RepID=UPI0013D4F99F|nr:alpha/beta hydrolase [Dysgonomonas sp. 511]NDV78599.1 alpha/beta hydrolase [Dysgonomonas sp. 511]